MITIFIVSKAAPVQPEEYFPYWIQVEIEMRPFRCSHFAFQAHDKLLVLLMDSRLRILVFSSTLFKSSRRNISNHSPPPQKNPQTKPQQQKTKQTKPPKLTRKPKTKQNNRKRIFTLLFSSKEKICSPEHPFLSVQPASLSLYIQLCKTYLVWFFILLNH